MSQYLVFSLGEDEYGLALASVREILAVGVVTRVPCAPRWVRGVTNVRGHVVPIVDLAVRFGLPGAPVTKRSAFVLIECVSEGQPLVLGIMADVVSRVVDVEPTDVRTVPSFGTTAAREFLTGLLASDRGFVHLIDGSRVFSDEERVVLSVAASRPATPAPSPAPSLKPPAAAAPAEADLGHEIMAGVVFFDEE